MRPWRKVPSPTMVAESSLKQSSSPVTASQTMQMHLNKVAWWLDLQASQNTGHLSSRALCDPPTPVPANVAATAVVERETPAALHSGLADAAEHVKLPTGGKMSASSSLPLDQLSGAARQLKGSRPLVEGTKQSSMGSSQGMTGSSQLVDGTSRLQQGACGPSFSPVSTSQKTIASAAVPGSPGNLTVPPKAASAASTVLGPKLQTCSEHGAAAASARTSEESGQQADTVGRTHVGDGIGHRYAQKTISSALLCCDKNSCSEYVALWEHIYMRTSHHKPAWNSVGFVNLPENCSSFEMALGVVLRCAVLCCAAMQRNHQYLCMSDSLTCQ